MSHHRVLNPGLWALLAALALTIVTTPASAQSDEASALEAAAKQLEFRLVGPAAISGRISDIAIHPDQPRTWYLATASGGVWKTDNAGTSFKPIMDGEGSYSFGTIVIDPSHPNVVWAGSGENNPQRSVSFGDGIYKSVDGGASWTNMGLGDSEHIARILIDPRDSDVVYVAAQGPLWNSGGDRGVYKTTDGGATWTQVLDAVDEWTGVADMAMDPSNPDVLIAATWQRARRQWSLIAGGPGSAIYRSTDGGITWTKSQKGFAGGEIGRIGLTISPVNPLVVYAIAESTKGGGFYRSTNGGINWEKMSGRTTSSNYYQELFADPKDVDKVYSVNTLTAVSEDGGATWENMSYGNRHVDDHVVWINPDETTHLLIGGDGGLYQSFDDGDTWDWFQNLPIAQFYRVEVDSLRPFYRIYGGTQDNSSMGGPSRTQSRRGADTGDWFLTQGGDGFVTRVDPTDPNIVYSESQYAGMSRFNLATGERVAITPMPEPGEDALRWNWDTPLLISPHNPARLYAAAQRVYRSDDRGSSWHPISGDLTAQTDRNTLKMMGRVWSVDAMAKNRSTSTWNSLVSMSESPVQEGLIWVGSDDGVVQVTEDGGENWRRFDVGEIDGLPGMTFTSTVLASVHDAQTAYIAIDNHKAGDYRPYIAKTTNLGQSWEIISGDLPEKGTVYIVKEDHKNPDLLFAGTEYGVFFSPNGGDSWHELGKGLPTIMVADMAIQKQHDDLVLGTFGRGFYVLDDLEILRTLVEGAAGESTGILPVTDAALFVESNPDPGWQGDRWWSASNPDVGARIFYYLPEGTTTRKARREKAESALRKEGGDVFYPPWDSLKAEDREESPKIVLTITDAEGAIIRRLNGSASKGLQSVTWNLRYPSFSSSGNGSGPMVAPGLYSVSMALHTDGSVAPIGSPQQFNVYPLHGDLTPRTPEVVAFQEETARLQRAMSGADAALREAMNRVEALESAFERTTADVSALSTRLDAVDSDLRGLRESLSGDPTRGRRNEPSPPSLMSRLRRISGWAWGGSVQEVTGTQRRQYEILAGELGGVIDSLRAAVEVKLASIEADAEAAGVPWTSGRIPNWRP